MQDKKVKFFSPNNINETIQISSKKESVISKYLQHKSAKNITASPTTNNINKDPQLNLWNIFIHINLSLLIWLKTMISYPITSRIPKAK